MKRRMKENSIKGLIYAVLFAMMIVGTMLEKPETKTTEGTHHTDTLFAPVTTRWTR